MIIKTPRNPTIHAQRRRVSADTAISASYALCDAAEDCSLCRSISTNWLPMVNLAQI
jgi:hypothetical protein